MEISRNPIKSTKSCFSLEYDANNDICVDCELVDSCKQFMGRRLDYVTLDKITFDLIPEKLNPGIMHIDEDPELVNIDGLYSLCYQSIFNTKPSDTIFHIKSAKQRLIDISESKRCSVKLFIMTNMMAHQEVSRDPFYANMLFGPTAIKRLDLYRKLCVKLWGCFDFDAIEFQLKRSIVPNENELYLSDVEFGSYIVGVKLRGKRVSHERLYIEKETQFEPLWLAIEPTYVPTLMKTGDTPSLRSFRFKVARIKSGLMKNKPKAIEAFKLRQTSAKRAVAEVLRRNGMRPKDLLSKNRVINDVAEFWSRVGLALAYIRCIKLAQGDIS